MRALSHGCIRTQHILDLATQLLGDDGGEWTPDKIQATLDSKKTVQANFVKPLPVYIVYFSSAALIDGRIVDYQDLYGRDAQGDRGAQHEGRRGERSPSRSRSRRRNRAKPQAEAIKQVATR